MSVKDAVSAGRRAAEALFFDVCSITRPQGRPTFNASVGVTTSPVALAVYEGRCKVQSRTLAPSSPEVGGEVITLEVLEVHVPISAGGVMIGDTVTIGAAEMDAELVGRRYRVTAVPSKSFATARRLRCEQITA